MAVNKKTSYPRERVKILLLEGIHSSAVEAFEELGYRPVLKESALSEEELLEEVTETHIIGVRSKTHLTPKVLNAAQNLLAVGCFCIGTNQVALKEATQCGVPVFNAPFSNTRSVAELVIAEVIMLARKASWRSLNMHQGVWTKSALGSHEVRGKTLGIIGYGHIGPQVGLLGEALGMNVLYFDIQKKLPLGNAQSVSQMEQVLQQSDFVSLHVPETPQTKLLIGSKEIALMKKGSILLNLSRGSVVDVDALCSALSSGHIAGAAVDVFPEEPKSNSEPFTSPLLGMPNVILTPHVGGSTEEAQLSIGREVSDSLLKFVEQGDTNGAVNFPQIDLPYIDQYHRILNIHRNVPGVLGNINSIIAETGANISAQYLSTNSDIGYLIMDVETGLSSQIKNELESIDANIRTRLLF